MSFKDFARSATQAFSSKGRSAVPKEGPVIVYSPSIDTENRSNNSVSMVFPRFSKYQEVASGVHQIVQDTLEGSFLRLDSHKKMPSADKWSKEVAGKINQRSERYIKSVGDTLRGSGDDSCTLTHINHTNVPKLKELSERFENKNLKALLVIPHDNKSGFNDSVMKGFTSATHGITNPDVVDNDRVDELENLSNFQFANRDAISNVLQGYADGSANYGCVVMNESQLDEFRPIMYRLPDPSSKWSSNKFTSAGTDIDSSFGGRNASIQSPESVFAELGDASPVTFEDVFDAAPFVPDAPRK